MKLKKTLIGLTAFAAFSGVQAEETLSVAATAVPHAEILEFIQPALKDNGVDLQVKVFTDYVQPNIQVDQKRMDANFFQHQPYLDEFNDGKGTDLVTVTGVHIEPFGAYSQKVDSLDALEEGATVAIPNDPTNGGRALLLLQDAGLIKLKDESKITATPRDIADNPKNLDFKELEVRHQFFVKLYPEIPATDPGPTDPLMQIPVLGVGFSDLHLLAHEALRQTFEISGRIPL